MNKKQILEQVSAAIDNEDVLPIEFFDKDFEHFNELQGFWSNQSLIKSAMVEEKSSYISNIDAIMAKINLEPEIHIAKTAEINNRVSDTYQRFKKWFNIALPIGITAAFMGVSIVAHNAINTKDMPSNQYFNAHQINDAHAYGLASLANLEEDDYIDSNIVVK